MSKQYLANIALKINVKVGILSLLMHYPRYLFLVEWSRNYSYHFGEQFGRNHHELCSTGMVWVLMERMSRGLCSTVRLASSYFIFVATNGILTRVHIVYAQEDERINGIDLATVVIHSLCQRKKLNKPPSTNDNNSYFMCHSIMRCLKNNMSVSKNSYKWRKKKKKKNQALRYNYI